MSVTIEPNPNQLNQQQELANRIAGFEWESPLFHWRVIQLDREPENFRVSESPGEWVGWTAAADQIQLSEAESYPETRGNTSQLLGSSLDFQPVWVDNRQE